MIQDGRKIQYIHQVKAATAEFYHKMDPKVGLLKLIPGIDGDYLRYFLERNDAIIIESFGVGGLPMVRVIISVRRLSGASIRARPLL